MNEPRDLVTGVTDSEIEEARIFLNSLYKYTREFHRTTGVQEWHEVDVIRTAQLIARHRLVEAERAQIVRDLQRATQADTFESTVWRLLAQLQTNKVVVDSPTELQARCANLETELAIVKQSAITGWESARILAIAPPTFGAPATEAAADKALALLREKR